MAAKALICAATVVAMAIGITACSGSSSNTSPTTTSSPAPSSSTQPSAPPGPSPTSTVPGASSNNSFWSQSLDRPRFVVPVPHVGVFGR